MTRRVDVARFIDERNVGAFQLVVLLLCFIIMMIDGFDAQAVGFVAPIISVAWGVSKPSLGPVFAAGLLGMALGALLFGALADRFGRKAIIVLCFVAFGLLTIAKAFDPNRIELQHRIVNAEQRIENLEAALGARLPVAYRTFLLSHREEPSRPVQVVSTNPDYWDVSCIFEIGDAESYLQVDHCYALVADVLPDGMLPVGEDQGGNLYLLDCRTGPSTGAVYWWDHEQELREDRVSLVATSFPEFLAALVPDS